LFVSAATIVGLIIAYWGIKKIADSVGNNGTQPIQMSVGIYNGVDAFVGRVEGTYGQVFTVQMSFRNISAETLAMIGCVSLPDSLEVVSGSTTVYNQRNPNGIIASTDKFFSSRGLNLGDYGFYDGIAQDSGSVSFKVRVSENAELFPPGINTLNVACQIAGYSNGVIVTDAIIAYAAIDVLVE